MEVRDVDAEVPEHRAIIADLPFPYDLGPEGRGRGDWFASLDD
jgi:hypothetical protein